MNSEQFFLQVRRALITLARALEKHDDNNAILVLLGVEDGDTVEVDIKKCYTIGDVQFNLQIKNDAVEPDNTPSPSSGKEVQSCTLTLRIRR